MDAHGTAVPRDPGLVHARHLQLPEIQQLRGILDHVRTAHIAQGPRVPRRRDLLRAQDAVDMGPDEPTARQDQHPFQGQGKQQRRHDAVHELPADADGHVRDDGVESGDHGWEED